MEMCEHCRMTVLLTADGKCPVCGRVMPSTVRAFYHGLLRREQELAAIARTRASQAYEIDTRLRSTVFMAKLLGGISAFLGTMPLVQFMVELSRGVCDVLAWGMFVVWVATGVADIVVASSLKDGRPWAVTTLLAISGVQVLLIVFGTVALRGACECVVLAGYWLLFLVVPLIVKLSQCYRIIRRVPTGSVPPTGRGFEPVMPVAAEPLEEPGERG
jgi:hypothetical protein